MIIKEVYAKTILSKSKVMDYTVNPYIGCEHGCTYCYARFMKRFTGHKEKWGSFVDLRINAPKLLQREIKKKPVGRIWISGTCDPYQPLERKYELTKKCLKILSRHDWPITIQTKSPLVKRDAHVLQQGNHPQGVAVPRYGPDPARKPFQKGPRPRRWPEVSDVSTHESQVWLFGENSFANRPRPLVRGMDVRSCQYPHVLTPLTPLRSPDRRRRRCRRLGTRGWLLHSVEGVLPAASPSARTSSESRSR